MDVFITDLAAFLPNAPIGNDTMEQTLGLFNQVPSRTRRIILRNNKINCRYYAIDPRTGLATHSNAELTAEAIRRLKPFAGFSVGDIECLCCGTSTPDQIMPGHGPMVHGELGGGPSEVMTAAGVCASGMAALKYAYMNVALGLCRNAVAAGSELASTFLKAGQCGPVEEQKFRALEEQPVLSFDADFLRWMLSDGAGAAFLSPRPAEEGLSLRIDWIDLLSFAHELETCMYAGATKNEDGTITGWRNQPSPAANGAFLIKQDVKLLNREIIRTAVDRTLPPLIEKRGLSPDQVDWFLPHYSSDFFRSRLHERMKEIGFDIPFERWFTNLPTKGNTGSASIFIILEELFSSGALERGQRLLCMVPESGRFSISYMMLTVV
jgi:3-oxoacyl-[acyl-carrier-protein] synthase-3